VLSARFTLVRKNLSVATGRSARGASRSYVRPAMDATLVQRIERAVRRSDPGLLRSTQAVETLGAGLLALWVSRSVGPQQRTLGRTRRAELATMAGMGLAMVLATGLGVGLGHRRGIAEATVVALAFATFAVRGILPGQAGFTLFAFVQLLVARAFPAGHPG